MRAHYLIPLCICCCATAQAAIPADLEGAFERYIALAKELTPLLQAAKDKTTAEAAAPALYNILPKVYETRTELMKIDALSPELRTELEQKYGKTMQKEWGKVYEEIFRLEKVNCYHSLSYFKQFRALCMMLQQ